MSGALPAVGCAADGPTAPVLVPATLYQPTTTTIQLEVAYGAGAAPYTGPIPNLGDTWKLTTSNLRAIFKGGGKQIVVPNDPSEMESIDGIEQASYTSADLVRIAEQHQQLHTSAATAIVFTVFLPGLYNDGNGPRADVLGASVGQTGVIALFQPAIVAATQQSNRPAIQRLVEQLVLVHELGHAVGLVDNGLAMAAAHKDAAHGSHCNNPDCVMYWLNEGVKDAIDFVNRKVQTGDEVVFGAECLADAKAAIGK